MAGPPRLCAADSAPVRRQQRRVPFGLLVLGILLPSAHGRGNWLFCGGPTGVQLAPGTLQLPLRSVASRMPCRQANVGSSEFRGVTRHESNGEWVAHVKDPRGGEDISLGLFKSKRDAAKAFDCATLVLGAAPEGTNFPAGSYEQQELDEMATRLRDHWRPMPSSKYYGVYQTRSNGLWKAEIELYGVKQFLDFFSDELEAAEAVDNAIRSTGAEKATQLQMLNFRMANDYFDADSWEEEQIPRGATSRFLGVTYHQPTGQFLAKIGRRHLGLFESELLAARAFDKASHAKGGPTNFPPLS